jgi:paraquat-inducible protein A
MASCLRCKAPLARYHGKSFNTGLALIISVVTLSIPAFTEPLFVVNLYGQERYNTVFSGITSLFTDTLWPLALMVLGFIFIIPAVWLGALLLVFVCLVRNSRPQWLPRTFRMAQMVDEWAMPEVFMIGAVVAYTRLRELTTVQVTSGGWCFFALAIMVMMLRLVVDHQQIWTTIGKELIEPAEGGDRVICPTCELPLSRASIGSPCPRCTSIVVRRKANSFNVTLALLASAYLLYIPANLLPVLRIVQLGRPNDSTILGGIRELAGTGMWPLAIIVFIASIAIPLLKLMGLSWCLAETWKQRGRSVIERTRLSRFIGRIGRWSNIDVFMVSVLTALMQFDLLGTVKAEAGAVAFGSVVILTMLASRLFDSRIMWDAAGFGGMPAALKDD